MNPVTERPPHALSPRIAAALRERLYELVRGHTMPRRGRDVDVYVRKVRIKLAEAAPDWSFIHTHHRVGCRFAPEKVDPSP